jgi:hypothetical protein
VFAPDIGALIVRIAMENPRWGYTRIQGALKQLDLRVGRSTIARVHHYERAAA